ncbi:MAG: WD40 repeat domain-containing protein [Bosea sp. (in: a-proteobacteria)]
MDMPPAQPVSLTQHVAPLEHSAHVITMGWLGDTLAVALSDGAVALHQGGHTTIVEAHPDAALLVARHDRKRLVTGGDDGRVVAINADGKIEELGRDAKRRWIDAIAIGPNDSVAWSAGKTITARDASGTLKSFEAPSSSQGLAFAPKGYRLMVAHVNGVSLWFPNAKAQPEFLEWKGSHLDATWSPDGRFIVTSLLENALHGWRLGTKPSHMRMTGYPAKPRSLSWSHDGLWLSSSGAEAVIIWPFQGDGPQGKAPRECGVRRARVTQGAFHPGSYVIAAGYDDGCILLIRMTDASELLVRPAVRDSAITSFAWDKAGKRLAFGCADGQGGILTLPT